MHYENHLNNTESLDDALSHLVKSIAVEEEALASLMRAEADKTLAFVGKEQDLPTQPSTAEFIQFNQTVTKILDSILMAEWMLMKKIDSIMEFQYLAQSSGLNITIKDQVGTHRENSSSSKHNQIFDNYNELDEIDY